MKSKIEKRLNRFYASEDKPTEVGKEGDYTYISHKSYKGVSVEGSVGILPVYDNVIIDSELNIGAVFVDGKVALADLRSGDLLTDFEYDRVEFAPENHSIILYKDGRKGIYNVKKREITLEAEYDVVSGIGNRYSWTFSPKRGYTVEDHQTGRSHVFGFSSIDECFDETEGHMFVLREERVMMIDENGNTDVPGYRRLVASLGGRLRLYNSARGLLLIADIYGCPL